MNLSSVNIIANAQALFSIIIVKESVHDDCKLTLKSLKAQIHQNFETLVIDWSTNIRNYNHYKRAWVQAPFKSQTRNIQHLKKAVLAAKGDYILLVKAGNFCVPHMLATFNQYVISKKCDVLYSDEAIFGDNINQILQTEIKGDYSDIKLIKHLYSGQSVVWSKVKLEEVLSQLLTNTFDTILREIFVRIYHKNINIQYIPQILLLKKNATETLKRK